MYDITTSKTNSCNNHIAQYLKKEKHNLGKNILFPSQEGKT